MPVQHAGFFRTISTDSVTGRVSTRWVILPMIVSDDRSSASPILDGSRARLTSDFHAGQELIQYHNKMGAKLRETKGGLPMSFNLTRRAVVGGLASSVALPAFAQNLPLPSSPVTLNFVDVAGNLALTQKAIEAYRDKNPKLVAKINFTKAPAPELPGKIKAQQDAGRVDIDG